MSAFGGKADIGLPSIIFHYHDQFLLTHRRSHTLPVALTSAGDQTASISAHPLRKEFRTRVKHLRPFLLPGELVWIDEPTKTSLLNTLRDAYSPETAAKLETLARIEHERWVIERKLDGWRYGPTRNDARRFHPLLISWEQLNKSNDEKQKDINQVLTALKFIAEKKSM
jgi:RyR domain